MNKCIHSNILLLFLLLFLCESAYCDNKTQTSHGFFNPYYDISSRIVNEEFVDELYKNMDSMSEFEGIRVENDMWKYLTPEQLEKIRVIVKEKIKNIDEESVNPLYIHMIDNYEGSLEKNNAVYEGRFTRTAQSAYGYSFFETTEGKTLKVLYRPWETIQPRTFDPDARHTVRIVVEKKKRKNSESEARHVLKIETFKNGRYSRL